MIRSTYLGVATVAVKLLESGAIGDIRAAANRDAIKAVQRIGQLGIARPADALRAPRTEASASVGSAAELLLLSIPHQSVDAAPEQGRTDLRYLNQRLRIEAADRVVPIPGTTDDSTIALDDLLTVSLCDLVLGLDALTLAIDGEALELDAAATEIITATAIAAARIRHGDMSVTRALLGPESIFGLGGA